MVGPIWMMATGDDDDDGGGGRGCGDNCDGKLDGGDDHSSPCSPLPS